MFLANSILKVSGYSREKKGKLLKKFALSVSDTPEERDIAKATSPLAILDVFGEATYFGQIEQIASLLPQAARYQFSESFLDACGTLIDKKRVMIWLNASMLYDCRMIPPG